MSFSLDGRGSIPILTTILFFAFFFFGRNKVSLTSESLTEVQLITGDPFHNTPDPILQLTNRPCIVTSPSHIRYSLKKKHYEKIDNLSHLLFETAKDDPSQFDDMTKQLFVLLRITVIYYRFELLYLFLDTEKSEKKHRQELADILASIVHSFIKDILNYLGNMNGCFGHVQILQW